MKGYPEQESATNMKNELPKTAQIEQFENNLSLLTALSLLHSIRRAQKK
jgi:hypothetical protein